MLYDDYDEDYASELRAEDMAKRFYQTKLLRHPHCQDPDHPGCEACEDYEEGNEE